MNLGKNNLLLILFLVFFFNTPSFSDDKILSSPLINLNELKPSFEEEDNSNNDSKINEIILKKKNVKNNNNSPSAKLIGLDKITAKTSEIMINLGETKKFGPLEIKVLKCGKEKSSKDNANVAYLQVRDISKSENEKVFIFNGWTFSSDPTIAPFDHAIYDLQLVNCSNI